MSRYAVLTKEFWADTLERTLSTAAQSVVAVVGVDQVMPSAFALDYKALAGVAAGGALLALVKAFAKLGATAPVSTVEVVRPPTDAEIAAYLAGQAPQADGEAA
jgi:hypothetical protein